LNLGIKSGDKVLEVGTGSGAFTIILSNAVGENGIVYSFEKRKDFLENAKENFEKFSKFKNVMFYNMDLEKETVPDIEVDAIFIDVPEPWKLIGNLKKVLKSGKGLASISPNIEQIKKTKEKLFFEKFVRIRIYEIILREILVREEGTRPKEYSITHTGYLIFANKVNE
jgi:tRNA (adenine57-N1/adenine58-N1)-methyltransferase